MRMAGQTSWWGRMLAVVDREYERRIRAASLVTEYGASHGAHHDDDDGDAAEIMNIPRGSRRPTFYAGDDESEDHHHAAV